MNGSHSCPTCGAFPVSKEVAARAVGVKSDHIAQIEDDQRLIRRLQGDISRLLAVLETAFEHSCTRSEGRGKWTQEDQTVHEAISAVIAKAS